ncbi:MAG TPA: hypothetical protein VF755_04355 [Catenuloplanes sp.]|jgi:hypothetical protein
MLVVFAFALLILAAAVVILFAMLAELATRVPERSSPLRDARIQPLEGALVGKAADVWPTPLPGADRAVLLILSTVCGACDDVAGQLVVDPGHTDWNDMAVVVSTAARENGEAFVERHGLSRVPVYIDENGEWVSGQFDVRTSPAALVFRDGRLSSAHVFHDVTSLRTMIEAAADHDTHHEEARHDDHKQKEAV